MPTGWRPDDANKPAGWRTGATPTVAQQQAKNVNMGAPDPGSGNKSAYKTPQAQGPQANPYGSESGPGILEQWFNQRATGTDPAFEYGLNRGMQTLGNRYSAAGAYNSGAARQGESDLYANLLSQRMGQLDSLAGGASGEHQNRLDSMFRTGLGLAGGQAGTSATYDIPMGGNMKDSAYARMMMEMNKAGVDSRANQQFYNNILGGAAAYTGITGGGRGGGGGGYTAPGTYPYDPNGLMAPTF